MSRRALEALLALKADTQLESLLATGLARPLTRPTSPHNLVRSRALGCWRASASLVLSHTLAFRWIPDY